MEDEATRDIATVKQLPEVNHFIGYPQLEDFLAKARADNGPLYVSLLRTPTLEIDVGEPMIYQTVITVQSITKKGDVRYWRMAIANTLFLRGEPFDDNAQTNHERARAAYALMLEYLEEEGFTLDHAIIAVPRTLKLTVGKASFWQYDKPSDRFVRVPQLIN